MSGVPQRSVLGPLLYLIYINDFNDNITSNVLKFADDTKVFRRINNNGDKNNLQNDLDRLVKWFEKWQTLLNFWKCKCLHRGHADMKVSEQCGISTSNGNKILGLIRKNIAYKEKKLIIPLHKAIVRPHLEYCV